MENLFKTKIKENEKMSKHTTFKTGGYAKYYIEITDSKEFIEAITWAKENNLSYFIIGNGSNLLISDKGYDGLIINTSRYNSIKLIGENIVEACCGCLLSDISAFALRNSLTNFEFASGIPGTLGGAIFMNAGAYGEEIKDILLDVNILNKDLSIKNIKASDLNLGYRYSNIEAKNQIILSAHLSLKKGKSEDIKNKIKDLNFRRRDKQPLEYPSAGSTFKRPKGYFAGKLISDANLRGYMIGGACVSTKHAGFVINKNDASSTDIYNLISYIQMVVKEKFNVNLEREVRLLGEF